MNINKNRVVIFILINLLQSCSWMNYNFYRDRVRPYLESIEDTYVPLVVDGVREPEVFPDLDENDETVEGIDLNKDGVRDDIEIFANRQIFSRYERELLKEKYRGYVKFYKNSSSEKTAAEIAKHYIALNLRQDTCDTAVLDQRGYQLNSSEISYRYDDLFINSNLRSNEIGNFIVISLDELKIISSDTAPGNEYIKYCFAMKDWLKS